MINYENRNVFYSKIFFRAIGHANKNDVTWSEKSAFDSLFFINKKIIISYLVEFTDVLSEKILFVKIFFFP